jgi:PEP-CTERM motif
VTTWKQAAIGLGIAAALPAVHAGTFPEVEPNDTLAGAQIISDPGSAQTFINGERTFANPSDDFFRFTVATPTMLYISSTSANAFADSIMGLYGPTGTLLASNDNASLGTSMSAITFLAAIAGNYTLGFSGFNPGLLSCTATVTSCYDTNNDFTFDTFVAGGGAGGSTGWNYAITIAVPEPETYLMLGLGLALAPWLGKRAAARRQKGASL